MRPLSAHTIVRLWEWGRGRNLADRALGLLAVALPDRSEDELASLSLGQRDALLLDLREKTFGPALGVYNECPNCGQGLECTVRVSDLTVFREGAESEPYGREFEFAWEDYSLRFRLPNTRDLTHVSTDKTPGEGRRVLAERCLLRATREGREAAFEEVPEQAIEAIAYRMIEHDPQAEVLLDLDCPACGHSWQVIFDIASFFWSEVSSRAMRLFREVHALARAYGWSETDILSMSSARRQIYLEMVT